MQDSVIITSFSQSDENPEPSLSIDTIDGFKFISSTKPVSIGTHDDGGYQKKRPKINDYNYVPLKGSIRRPLSQLRNTNCLEDGKHLSNGPRNQPIIRKTGKHVRLGRTLLKKGIELKKNQPSVGNTNTISIGQTSRKDVNIGFNCQTSVATRSRYTLAKNVNRSGDQNQIGTVLKKLGKCIHRQLDTNCFEQTFNQLSTSSELPQPSLQPLSKSLSHSSLPTLQLLCSNSQIPDDPDELDKLLEKHPNKKRNGPDARHFSCGYINLPIIKETSIPWLTPDHLDAIYYDMALNAERIQSIRTQTVIWKDSVLNEEKLEAILPIEK